MNHNRKFIAKLPKNHLLIITLITNLILFLEYTQTQSLTQCNRKSYCLGCDSVIQDKCTACFNSTGGTGPRALSFDTEQGVNNCKDALGPSQVIQGCKHYSGKEKKGGVSDVNTCQRCEDHFLNYDEKTGVVKCSEMKGPGCADLANPIPFCLNTVCFAGKSGNSYGCRMCDKKYSGYIWDENNNAGS